MTWDGDPEAVRGAVVIMAKAPREGSAKTRLSGAYPAAEVAKLSECMLRDTVALVQGLAGMRLAVMCPFFSPQEKARCTAVIAPRRWFGPHFGCASAQFSTWKGLRSVTRSVSAFGSDWRKDCRCF